MTRFFVTAITTRFEEATGNFVADRSGCLAVAVISGSG